MGNCSDAPAVPISIKNHRFKVQNSLFLMKIQAVSSFLAHFKAEKHLVFEFCCLPKA